MEETTVTVQYCISELQEVFVFVVLLLHCLEVTCFNIFIQVVKVVCCMPSLYDGDRMLYKCYTDAIPPKKKNSY